MKHEELTGKIIQIFYEVYNELGHGFLESVYENAMRLALADAGMEVMAKEKIKVWFRDQEVGLFEPDILIGNCVILEIKAGRALDAAHESQLLNYLRATQIEVGLLLHFGPKPAMKRLVFDNTRKRLPPPLLSAKPLPRPNSLRHHLSSPPSSFSYPCHPCSSAATALLPSSPSLASTSRTGFFRFIVTVCHGGYPKITI